MASMKDALEEAFLGGNVWIKYMIFAIPLHCLGVLIYGKSNLNSIAIFSVPTFIFFLGFMVDCTYNVRKGNPSVLPSFNIFKIFFDGLKCSIVLAPFIAFGYFIPKMIIDYITPFIPQGTFALVFGIVIYIVFSSLTFTSYLLYSRRFEISDAFDLKKIFNYCIDVLVAMVVMLIMLALIDVVLLFPVNYIVWLFFGIPSLVAIYCWSVAAVLNIAMIGHYMAQIDYEIIPYNEMEQDEL